MVRYPHTITVTIPGTSVQDEVSGEYVVTDPQVKTVACYVGGNSRGKKIGSADGQMVDYFALAIMEKVDWLAPFGAMALVTMLGGHTFNTTVKAMQHFSSHSQIWL